MFIYRNMDYARSRGIEIEVKKKISRLWGGNLVYTYSVATGKSSDPNTLKLIQEQGGDVGAREASLAEEYLWWNRPHKLNLTLQLQDARRGEAQALGRSRCPRTGTRPSSGCSRAASPTRRPGTSEEVGKRYSANGPRDDIIDLKITKYFGAQGGTGSRARSISQIDNVFNRRTVRSIDPETGEAPQVGKGSYVDEAGSQYYINLYSSPSLYGEPRSARLGMGIEW